MKFILQLAISLALLVSSIGGEFQRGKASWYSEKSNGGTATASGVPFDENANTAAHKKLPLGTKVRVTNLKNNKSVVCIITDRGPYIKGRIIDVSKGVAKKLGFLKNGVVPVKVQVVGKVKLRRR